MIIHYLQKNLKLVMICCYYSKIASKYGIKVGGVKKLIRNLGKKSKYVI